MSSGNYTPHRGVLILILGIVGWVLCPLTAPMAWVMGKADIEQMDRDEMDPEGRGLTQAGMILGMVACALWVLGVLFGVAAMLFLTPVAMSSAG